jgi:SAM-dependent methyltransferase
MVKLANQSQYWDKVSLIKSFTHPIETTKLQSYLSKDSDILDYGCGYGRSCNELNSLGYENVLGVDSSQKMIDRGLKKYPNLELSPFKGDFSKIGQYDAIFLFAVLTCIPINASQIELIEQLTKHLNPNGILYISDYWLQDNARNLARYDEFEKKYGTHGVFELPDGAVVRHHSRKWIEQLVSGLETKELYDCELTSMNGNNSSCFQFIGKKK